MDSTTLIYIFDDDPIILETVRLLITEEMKLKCVPFLPTQRKEFMRQVMLEIPSLVILDQHLSDTLKGTDILVELRETGYRGTVTFLSGEADPELPAKSLNLTADDFIAKPFTPSYFIAKINALLRRAARAEDPRIRGDAHATDDDFKFSNCTISPRTMLATCPKGKKTVMMTPFILAVAQALHKNRESVVTRDELIHKIWGAGTPVKSRTLDQAIYDLKKRLNRIGGDDEMVLNVKGVGYRYTEKPQPKG